MSYLYDDEDNQPMMDEHMPVRDVDRDCPNCRNRKNGECQVWECKFSPKGGSGSEGR